MARGARRWRLSASELCLLDEARQVVRRVEDAPVGMVECSDAKGAWLVMADDERLTKGQRVRLVREADGGEG